MFDVKKMLSLFKLRPITVDRLDFTSSLLLQVFDTVTMTMIPQ